ncbi:MAG: hypothetical protein EON96_15280, partial [Caulobacteraceae bacterium]
MDADLIIRHAHPGRSSPSDHHCRDACGPWQPKIAGRGVFRRAQPGVRSVSFVTRFAPSPTGRLHKGHAFSALTAWTAARQNDGAFLLRIEDIDPTRCRPEFDEGIREDLDWLGLDWRRPVRRQSDHLADYNAVVRSLDHRDLLYRCFRTRKEVLDAIGDAPHGSVDAVRPGPHTLSEEAAFIAEGRPFAWRLSLDRARQVLGEQVWNALSFVEEGEGPEGETG